MKHSLYIDLILDFAEEFFSVLQGEFMSRAHPTDAPFSPPPFPGVSENDQMTYCWSSECLANTSTQENAKVGPTGVCYREGLYCTGPTI